MPSRGKRCEKNEESVQIGKIGEEKALSFLKKNEYRLLNRNYRCPLGEIDIIATEGNSLVFVEVKTRRTSTFGPPHMAVDRQKQIKMTKVALYYMKEKRLHEISARFDVLGVSMEEGKASFDLIKNAFESPIT